MATDEVDSPLETPEELPESTVPPETPADPPEPETPVPDQKPEAVMMERIEGMSRSLQKVTQELAQLNRNSVKQGGELTEVQEAKRRKAEADAVRIQQELETYTQAEGEEDFSQKLTKSHLATSRRVEALEKKIQALTKPDQWEEIQANHPGVNAKQVWKDANAAAGKSQAVINAAAMLDAGTISQEVYGEIYRGVASDIFNAKVSTAAKPKKLPTASVPPPSPPNGGRAVPMRGGATPAPVPHLDDPYMAAVMAASEAMDKAK